MLAPIRQRIQAPDEPIRGRPYQGMKTIISRLHVLIIVGYLAIWSVAPVDAAAQQRGPQAPCQGPTASAICGQEHTTMAGLAVGLVLCVVGAVLSWKSLTSTAPQDPGELSVQVLGVQARLTKAMPGALLFVVGVAVFWITRYDVTLT